MPYASISHILFSGLQSAHNVISRLSGGVLHNTNLVVRGQCHMEGLEESAEN